jgi:hypothetical protein
MGLIANNPHHFAGAIDSPASDKAARFLQLLDAFDLPCISLMDCPGMMVGPEVESTGLVRHCARLFNTGANGASRLSQDDQPHSPHFPRAKAAPKHSSSTHIGRLRWSCTRFVDTQLPFQCSRLSSARPTAWVFRPCAVGRPRCLSAAPRGRRANSPGWGSKDPSSSDSTLPLGFLCR